MESFLFLSSKTPCTDLWSHPESLRFRKGELKCSEIIYKPNLFQEEVYPKFLWQENQRNEDQQLKTAVDHIVCGIVVSGLQDTGVQPRIGQITRDMLVI